jgi:hypothetical protein
LAKLRHLATILTLSLILVAAALSSSNARAGVSESVLALAVPLAEGFGVSAESVTGLLESGVSLESVTQLLFVSESSGTDLDSATKLYRESGEDISKTADKLDVAAAEYSPEKVKGAIDDAGAKAQADARAKAETAVNDAAGKANSAANDATDEAAKKANDAMGSALGGFNR